jgi:hypothetical protein
MSEMIKLAVRCEAATGADRRLDYEIMTATVPVGHAYLWDPNDQSHRYTSSLDAAMTLVPAGLRLAFSEWDDEKHLRPRGPWQAILTKAGSGSSFNDMLGYRCDHAATPALAVCASALRARLLERREG